MEKRKKMSDLDLQKPLSGLPKGNDTCTEFCKVSWLLSDQRKWRFGMRKCINLQLYYSKAQRRSSMEH